MKKNNITKLHGTASFVNNNEVKILDASGTETQISSDKFIIATGSKPSSIPGIEIDKKRIITSTEALALTEQPKEIIIIGGGVIGVEMASIFNRIGTKVTILEYADYLIATMDHELGKTLQKILKKEGVDIQLQQSVYKVENQGDSAKVWFKDKNGTEQTLQADYVLMAVGRRPFTQGLGLENTSVKLT